MLPLDHVIAVLLLLWPPIWGATYGYSRLKRAPFERLATLRLEVYRNAALLQWITVALVLTYWFTNRRSAFELGLVPRLTFGLGGIAIGIVVVTVAMVRARTRALEDERMLRAMLGRLRNVESLLPTTPREMRGFAMLSVTAGICEEILYRGFLIWYLMHWMGLVPAVLVGGAIFGVAHSYQGVKGMLTTGFAGIFMGGVFAVSGSLIAPMVMHALMDLHSGHLGYVALKRRVEWEAEARAEAEAAAAAEVAVDA